MVLIPTAAQQTRRQKSFARTSSGKHPRPSMPRATSNASSTRSSLPSPLMMVLYVRVCANDPPGDCSMDRRIFLASSSSPHLQREGEIERGKRNGREARGEGWGLEGREKKTCYSRALISEVN